jgi:hypothetical protein
MRFAAVLLILGSGGGLGPAPGLPATPPTVAAMPAAIAASTQNASDPASHRAEVVYSGGELKVTADDSSLNQILREIASETGMKITGGVADERVYGKYGPAPLSPVLASLLEGTSSNMILKESGEGAAAELILTPKNGSPSPPSPNFSGQGDYRRAQQQINGPSQYPGSTAGALPAWSPATQPTQASQPGGAGGAPAYTPPPAPAPAAAPTASSEPAGTSDTTSETRDVASPNGVKSPQQIYQDLQQLQQQQQANPK